MEYIFKDILGWFEKDRWFFWDEAGLENGPYESELEAQASLEAYVKWELKGEKSPIRKMRDNMGS